mgnify:CR=1 FL=1
MKPHIIYILGSGHSGSTILQYLLAGNPNVVGLGEVRQMADGRGWNNEADDCSCGNAVQACPLWQGLQANPVEEGLDWYKRLINRTAELYPQATHLVDSSKSVHTIAPWINLTSEGIISGVRVIYLVRDVRGWAVSDENTRKRKNRPSRSVVTSMLSWWTAQLRMMHYLKNQKDFIPLTVSYESLIFQTNTQLFRIAAFCNIPGEGTNWEKALKTSTVHDVFGNRMKNDPFVRSRLTYDDRWQYRMAVNLALPVLYPVWRLNSKLRMLSGVEHK